jgi:hypothetical protein
MKETEVFLKDNLIHIIELWGTELKQLLESHFPF